MSCIQCIVVMYYILPIVVYVHTTIAVLCGVFIAISFHVLRLKRQGIAMNDALTSMDKRKVTRRVEDQGASLNLIKEAVEGFSDAADRFNNRLALLEDAGDATALRAANEQLLMVERLFIIPQVQKKCALSFVAALFDADDVFGSCSPGPSFEPH